ncbi:hypothetical protein ACNI3K_06805 [Demequina sp. SO4-13]|uniref:hypothetical protein n=1 Tax=Demequina sp. SO4-13 TaxID=3401027 RepID=UPI003AF929CE
MKLLPATYLASYTLSALGNSIAAVGPAVLAGTCMGVVIDRINRRSFSAAMVRTTSRRSTN